MGNFESISRYGETSFALKGSFKSHCYSSFLITFVRGIDNQPTEQELAITLPGAFCGIEKNITISRRHGSAQIWNFRGPDFELGLNQSALSDREFSTWLSRAVRRRLIPYQGNESYFGAQMGLADMSELRDAFGKFVVFMRTMPFADGPLKIQSANFFHVPRHRWYEENPYRGFGGAITEPLKDFVSDIGNKIGIFSQFDIKRDRDGLFQINIKINELWYNIMDVGYGIHSILPILISLYRQGDDTVTLYEQPEAHVHPAAQAALAQALVESPGRFVIETHSDHLIDRLRICVMQGLLAEDELKIIYFDKRKHIEQVSVHNISVDTNGNLIGEPKGYRDFFVNEAMHLLGVS